MSGPVFICFSREHDAPYARRLATHLVASGLPILYDTQPVTDSWWSAYTRSQLDGCSAVILVMTPAAQRDGWVAREIEHARRLGRPVLPLLLDGRPWPGVAEHEDVTGGGLPGSDFARRLRAATGGVPAAVEAPDSGFAVPVRGGVTGTAVGIEVGGGAFLPLIEAGTVVPCASTQLFTTADDGQPVLRVRVYHGDRPTVADNRSLGVYELLLEPAPAGTPQIGVTLRVEHTGVFRLTAVQADGREVPVRLL
ncbi:Hsp70 family protein [Catellatospora aurea]|uniref:Hsp70 family protein n=1 Tax=Catellatospora aurea TaxID=1337874 RepID=A0ABW2H5U6_9ACTN